MDRSPVTVIKVAPGANVSIHVGDLSISGTNGPITITGPNPQPLPNDRSWFGRLVGALGRALPFFALLHGNSSHH